MQFWVQDVKPAWLPEGFEVFEKPPEMINSVQQLCKEAEIAYYQIDKDRNGFLRRREFKKAMKLLGINKYEAKHMLIFVDQERLKVVSIKNFMNAYLFIKSGGLSHDTTDYQGPITTGVDKRVHMKTPLQTISNQATPVHQFQSQLTFPVFQSIPKPIRTPVGFNATLKAANGMYLCSENGRVIANRPVASYWEKFFYFTDDTWTNYPRIYAFRTNWNTYLTCEMNNTISDNRTAVGPWEKFESIGQPNVGVKAYAYKSWTGKYLSADAAGNVSFADSIGPNEVWTLQYVD